jgi:mannose/cellobiose epimerase-like protein (N-acyl-D-glucosamine 2-epimerase family)
MDYARADLIAGYVVDSDPHGAWLDLKTTDGRPFRVQLTADTSAEIVRNLGEPRQRLSAPLRECLTSGRYLYARGIGYHHGSARTFEATEITFVGRAEDEQRFDEGDWWIAQIRELAGFYHRAQFPRGEADFEAFRTLISLDGTKVSSSRQEAATLSRTVYGFATAYLLTGEDRHLLAAERGTDYLREHFRHLDGAGRFVCWHHAVDVQDGRKGTVLASQCGEDSGTIPAYEQIYALTGPVQTYRITGDPRILDDAQRTVDLFTGTFRDEVHGGFFSHADPVSLDPRDPALGPNRARKNWNSIGDHAPAYLVNLWLATGDPRLEKLLADIADMIVERFPDPASPFVHERFHEDWTPDTGWGWQRDRAIVGHNLKIAWTLARIHQLRPDARYVALARRIADAMPEVALDRQRGGWYDVMARSRAPGEDFHRVVWHDRKAWWQQEEAILAYLLLGCAFGDESYRKQARESIAFYNTWFPDHDAGGVYFSVLADGLPYLMGPERLKGSHAMAGYHSFELCYVATVYSSLFLHNRPLDLHFRPCPGGFGDGVLRVRPELLPPGSVRLESVWIDGEPWSAFDAGELTVRLPRRPHHPPGTALDRPRVRVRLVRAGSPERSRSAG